MVGTILLAVYVIAYLSNTLLSYIIFYVNISEMIFAFVIIFFGLGFILYFFHHQFEKLAEIANEIEATPAQVALAWILSRDVHITAIPGTRRTERLEENWASQNITLQKEHLDRLKSIINQGVTGDRY